MTRFAILILAILLATSLVEQTPMQGQLEPIIVDIPIRTVQISTISSLDYNEPIIENYEYDYQLFEVTAYTAGPESTGKHPGDPAYGITASGAFVQENRTLACPPSMDFGTEIFIPYFNQVFVCEDRGGAITEGKLDVYMPNLTDALEFGRRKLEVLVLDKP